MLFRNSRRAGIVFLVLIVRGVLVHGAAKPFLKKVDDARPLRPD
jgi:hypothetical protein